MSVRARGPQDADIWSIVRMYLARLKRWQWIVLALLVGFTGGYVRQAAMDFDDKVDTYGLLQPKHGKFEKSLTTDWGGHRQFKDIVVYPYKIPNKKGAHQIVHIVSGRYWDGKPQIVQGETVANYTKMFYLAPVPYKPVTPLQEEFPATGTVIDFLKQMQKSHGVQFRYAWWWWAVTPTAVWLTFSLVVIGGIFPTI